MKALTVDVRESTGRILCCTIFRNGGKKLLAKGHIISEEDVRLLETEGMQEVWVTELEDGEIGEDDTVTAGGLRNGLRLPGNQDRGRRSSQPGCYGRLLCACG